MPLTVRCSCGVAVPIAGSSATAPLRCPACGKAIATPIDPRTSAWLILGIPVALVFVFAAVALVLWLNDRPPASAPASRVAKQSERSTAASAEREPQPAKEIPSQSKPSASIPEASKSERPESAEERPAPEVASKDEVKRDAATPDREPAPVRVAKEMPRREGLADKKPESPLRFERAGKPGIGLALELAIVRKKDLTYKVRRLQVPEVAGEPGRLRLAVTPPQYDDMGILLRQLGSGYDYTDIRLPDLESIERIRSYKVVFLTCGGEPAPPRVPATLRQFVEEGGTLYASDLRYDVVGAAFPEYRAAPTPLPRPTALAVVNSRALVEGAGNQTVDAEVVDSGLRQFLGRSHLPLHFDAPGWQPALFDKAKSTAYLVGQYKTFFGSLNKARLLVKFRHKEGAVIFTSFHNAAQSSELEKKLLQFLVFSAVNAKAENTLRDILLGAGFSLVDLENQKLAEKTVEVTKTHNHAGGGLQVALGFESLGARLRLVLTAPDGQVIEHEEGATFLVEVPEARAGEWRIAIRGEEVPFANFPFLLAVARSR